MARPRGKQLPNRICVSLDNEAYAGDAERTKLEYDLVVNKTILLTTAILGSRDTKKKPVRHYSGSDDPQIRYRGGLGYE